MYYRHPPWEDNGSIYIPTILSKRYLICLAKGTFPGKRVFLGGPVFARKRGLESFWGKCLKQIRVPTKLHFKKIAMGG